MSDNTPSLAPLRSPSGIEGQQQVKLEPREKHQHIQQQQQQQQQSEDEGKHESFLSGRP